MAKIRNPAAYAAWLARKQMAEQQQKNVQEAEQRGAAEALQRQQLLAAIIQQAAIKESQKSGVKRGEMPLGVYEELFGGATPIPGYNVRKSAYQDLNLGVD